ncbi:MAG: uroporphyrinogen decarboxylase family protein [Eubacteriaceae bacterium]
MLSIKDNFEETIHGGKPDRFVKQYEFMDIILESPGWIIPKPGETVLDNWGVTWTWKEGQIGAFPVHKPELIAVKDIDNWENELKVPDVHYSDEEWKAAVDHAEAIRQDGSKFVATIVAPGIFERTHHLMSMDEALCNYYEEPEAMHAFIDRLTQYELDWAQEVWDHLHPEVIFHHDDWGGQRTTFMSPEMFDEFILPAYKKIYGKYKELGVKYIVHHCDSYAATLVPEMIDMGVDVWQGCMTTNNVPELIEKYGEKITFMGDIDSGVVDFPAWTRDIIEENTREAVDECGKLYFIPCLTQGLGFSSFPGVYETTDEVIDELSKEKF